MGATARIDVPQERIADFCRRRHIRKLSFFGSVLRDDFAPESDVDVLVEFERGTQVGLIALSGMEIELSGILGRKVDMNTEGLLSPFFRDEVLREAASAYEQA
jgi:hypothetical protein